MRDEGKRLIVAAALALLTGCATAAPPALPVAELKQDDITIALHREPCALAAVANLRYRATWHDPKRGHFEGCYTIQHDTIVVLYFEDRMIITAPLRAFGPPAPATGSGRPISI